MDDNARRTLEGWRRGRVSGPRHTRPDESESRELPPEMFARLLAGEPLAQVRAEAEQRAPSRDRWNEEIRRKAGLEPPESGDSQAPWINTREGTIATDQFGSGDEQIQAGPYPALERPQRARRRDDGGRFTPDRGS